MPHFSLPVTCSFIRLWLDRNEKLGEKGWGLHLNPLVKPQLHSLVWRKLALEGRACTLKIPELTCLTSHTPISVASLSHQHEKSGRAFHAYWFLTKLNPIALGTSQDHFRVGGARPLLETDSPHSSLASFKTDQLPMAGPM